MCEKGPGDGGVVVDQVGLKGAEYILIVRCQGTAVGQVRRLLSVVSCLIGR